MIKIELFCHLKAVFGRWRIWSYLALASAFFDTPIFIGSDRIGNFGMSVLWEIIGEWSGNRFFMLFAQNKICFCVLPFLVYHSSFINMVLCIWISCLLALLFVPLVSYPRPGWIVSLDFEHPFSSFFHFFVFKNMVILLLVFSFISILHFWW